MRAAPAQHVAQHGEQREHVVGNAALIPRERRKAGLEIFPHREQRKNFAPLRNVGDAAARPFVGRKRRDVGAIEADRAARHRMLAGKRIEQARLADPVAAEDARDFAGLRLERNRAQRLGGAVVQVEGVDFEHVANANSE